MESIYDNGKKIVGITPYTKVVGGTHLLNKQVAKIFGEKLPLAQR
jgi:hypothetical protein